MSKPAMDEATLVVSAALVGVCFLAVRLFVTHRQTEIPLHRKGAHAPSVPSRLPLGLDVALAACRKMMAHEFLDWTGEILQNNGWTVELNMLKTRVVLTAHPDNIKAVLSTQFSEFGHGHQMHEAFKGVLGDSIFSTDGELWLENKKLLRPHVTKSRRTDAEKIEKHVQRLIQSIPGDGDSVEVYDLIDRYQLDVVTDVFLGKSADSLVENRQPFRDAVDSLLRLSTLRIVLGPIGSILPDSWLVPRALRDYNAYLDTFVVHAQGAPGMAIPQGLAEKSQEMNMMDSMVRQGMSAKAIKDQLTAVLLAAKDPVAILLTWCLWELSRRPDIFKRLREEIATSLPGARHPKPEDIRDLPYLRNVINETIRMYHPVGLNVRQAKVDTFLPIGGGVDRTESVWIPAGTTVAYSIHNLQRRADLVGTDADTFRPERWETWTPATWAFIPFNHGPRICLGRVFGHFELAYTLVRLLQTFARIEPGHGAVDCQKIKLEMNTKMAFPVPCRFFRD